MLAYLLANKPKSVGNPTTDVGAVLAPPLLGGSNGGMGLQIWAGHWKTFVGHIYTYAVYDKM